MLITCSTAVMRSTLLNTMSRILESFLMSRHFDRNMRMLLLMSIAANSVSGFRKHKALPLHDLMAAVSFEWLTQAFGA